MEPCPIWLSSPGDTELGGLMTSYELAARMQLSVPGISDLTTEPLMF